MHRVGSFLAAETCLVFRMDRIMLYVHICNWYIFHAISGIFAYLNYSSPHTREEIINILMTGLKRLEYRGYDSAGMNYASFSVFIL